MPSLFSARWRAATWLAGLRRSEHPGTRRVGDAHLLLDDQAALGDRDAVDGVSVCATVKRPDTDRWSVGAAGRAAGRAKGTQNTRIPMGSTGAAPMGCGAMGGAMSMAGMGDVGGNGRRRVRGRWERAGRAPPRWGAGLSGHGIGASGLISLRAPMGGGAAMAGYGPSDAGGGRGFLGSFLPGGHLLSSSEFELNRKQHGGVVSLWSRTSRSHFTGMERVSLNGEVRTTIFGTDYARGPLTVGLSVGRTLELGGYSGPERRADDDVDDRVYPATRSVTAFRSGGDRLRHRRAEPDADGAGALNTGVSMMMSAVGTRGELSARGPRAGSRWRSRPTRCWCRDGRGHGCRRRPRLHRHGHGAVAGGAVADAGGAPGRGVRRAWDVAVVRVGPAALEPAGADGASAPTAVVTVRGTTWRLTGSRGGPPIDDDERAVRPPRFHDQGRATAAVGRDVLQGPASPARPVQPGRERPLGAAETQAAVVTTCHRSRPAPCARYRPPPRSPGAPGDDQEHTLGQELADDPATAHAKRTANGELAPRGDATHQQHAGHVGAGHQQDQSRGGSSRRVASPPETERPHRLDADRLPRDGSQ